MAARALNSTHPLLWAGASTARRMPGSKCRGAPFSGLSSATGSFHDFARFFTLQMSATLYTEQYFGRPMDREVGRPRAEGASLAAL